MDRFDLMTNIVNNGENAYQASMKIEFHGDLQIVGVDIDQVKMLSAESLSRLSICLKQPEGNIAFCLLYSLYLYLEPPFFLIIPRCVFLMEHVGSTVYI